VMSLFQHLSSSGRSSLYGAAFNQIDREIPWSTCIFGLGGLLMRTLVALCLFGSSGDRQPNKSGKNIAASAPSPGVSVRMWSGPTTHRQRQKSTGEKADSPVPAFLPKNHSACGETFCSFQLSHPFQSLAAASSTLAFTQGIDLSFRPLLVSLKPNKPYRFSRSRRAPGPHDTAIRLGIELQVGRPATLSRSPHP
jgi:hypothetical protein